MIKKNQGAITGVILLLIAISFLFTACTLDDWEELGVAKPTIEYDKATGKRFNKPHASILKVKQLSSCTSERGRICIRAFRLHLELINDGNAEILRVFCDVEVYDDAENLAAQRSCEKKTFQEDLTGKIRDTWSPGEKVSFECIVWAHEGRGYEFDPAYVSKLRVRVAKLELLDN